MFLEPAKFRHGTPVDFKKKDFYQSTFKIETAAHAPLKYVWT